MGQSPTVSETSTKSSGGFVNYTNQRAMIVEISNVPGVGGKVGTPTVARTTTVATRSSVAVSVGSLVVIQGVRDSRFNGTYSVGEIENGTLFSYLQDLLSQEGEGPTAAQEGPRTVTGGVLSGGMGVWGPPLVGVEAKSYGPFAYLVVSYSEIQRAFRKAGVPMSQFSDYDGPKCWPTPPSIAWAVSPGTTIKYILISKRAQAEMTMLINNDYAFRMPSQYLTQFPTDKEGPYAWWPRSPRFYFTPVDPTLAVKALRPWVSVF